MVNPVAEIKKQLKEGMTQVELARRIGVHETYVSLFLAGIRAPNAKVLKYLGLRKEVRVRYVRANGKEAPSFSPDFDERNEIR